MSFSLDNPGFSTVGEDMDLVMDNPSQPPSGSSSSAPSSGEPSGELPQMSWEDE